MLKLAVILRNVYLNRILQAINKTIELHLENGSFIKRVLFLQRIALGFQKLINHSFVCFSFTAR